jgi:transcriptional regulator with XRE-family HTH domain
VFNLKDISKKIRDLRKQHKDTLEELGEKLNFNPSNLSKIERGIRKPTIELVEQLMKIYDVPLTYFFGEESEMQEELKDLGADWVAFVEEMEEKQITPDEIKAIMEILGKIKR